MGGSPGQSPSVRTSYGFTRVSLALGFCLGSASTHFPGGLIGVFVFSTHRLLLLLNSPSKAFLLPLGQNINREGG